MKQTTIQFDKRKQEPVTLKRLQHAVDLIATGTQITKAIRAAGIGSTFGKFLVQAKIIVKLEGKKVLVLKPILERKDLYRVLDLQTKDNIKRKKNRDAISFYEQKKDSPFIGRVPLPSEVNLPVEIQSVRVRGKGRAKKAVALPWWKRILLYLLNH
jgi:hypothetical protein